MLNFDRQRLAGEVLVWSPSHWPV